MRIYIIEDDVSVISILEDIIERESLGLVCGTTEDRRADTADILAQAPDLILIDLLMPEKDGIQLVRELRALGCTSKFIMISQVSAKEMIAKAYQAGIEFFIQKPINLIEIRQVISNVSRQLQNERALHGIQSILGAPPAAAPPVPERDTVLRQRLQHILSHLGMAGEKGATDLVDICLYLIREEETAAHLGIGTLCARLSENPKSMEQRLRRAVERGLRHLASLGLEDYGNEYFNRYAARLFPYSEVRAEMAHLQHKGPRGKIVLRMFIDGMLALASEYD